MEKQRLIGRDVFVDMGHDKTGQDRGQLFHHKWHTNKCPQESHSPLWLFCTGPFDQICQEQSQFWRVPKSVSSSRWYHNNRALYPCRADLLTLVHKLKNHVVLALCKRRERQLVFCAVDGRKQYADKVENVGCKLRSS